MYFIATKKLTIADELDDALVWLLINDLHYYHSRKL